MFVVVSSKHEDIGEVAGPFDHKDDAEQYLKMKYKERSITWGEVHDLTAPGEDFADHKLQEAMAGVH